MGSSFSQPQHESSRLLKAAESGKKKDVLRLIAGNPLLVATPSASSGCTFWHAAAQRAQADVITAVAAHIQLIWDGQLRESLSWDGDTVNPCIPESNQLLSYLVNLTDKKGRTPLILACIRGSSQTVDALLSLGANPRVMMRNGKLALHYAAQHGHTRQVLQLLQWWQQQQQHGVESNGAFLDAATSHGVTPLHLAVLRCHPATVKVLVEHGASVTNTCTYPHKGPRWLTHKYDGCTALHLAAATGSKTITCLLLAAHFQGGRLVDDQDPRTIRNHQGRLAVDIALGRGYRRVAEVLEPTAPLSTFMSRRDLGLTPIPTLVQLAGQALQKKLLMELEEVEVGLKVQQQQQKEPLLCPALTPSTKQDLISTLRSSLNSEDSPFLSPLHSFQQDSSTTTSPLSSHDEGERQEESHNDGTTPSPFSNPTSSSALHDNAGAQSSLNLRSQRLTSSPLYTVLNVNTQESSASSQASSAPSPRTTQLHPTAVTGGSEDAGGGAAASASSSGWSDAGLEVPEADGTPQSEVKASKRPRRTSRSRRRNAVFGVPGNTQGASSSEHEPLMPVEQFASSVVTGADAQLLPETLSLGGPLPGDSEDDGSLDLDGGACCETGKPQVEPATQATGGILTSASHLIGGTLKAFRVGHHRSRSANGSQGGNGPLSIIASMVAVAPEMGGARPGITADGWSSATMADWTASTSASGNTLHAALLAIPVDDDDEDDMCEVCMDRPMEVTVVSCQHRMCVECCRSVLKMRDMCAPLCPFCRGQIEGLK